MLPPRKGRTARAGRTGTISAAEFNRRRLAVLRRQPPVKVPSVALPVSVWAPYARDLRAVAAGAYAIADATIGAAVRSLAARQDRDDPDPGDPDESPDRPYATATPKPKAQPLPLEIERASKSFAARLAAYTVALRIPEIVDPAGERVFAANDRANIAVSKTLGLRAVRPDTRLAALAEQWSATNAALIVSQPAEIADRVHTIIAREVPLGTRWETISKQLQAEHGIAERRANLIARDQASKYNADLNRVRQTAAGITHYEWRGTMDARERPSHVALQGMVFAWDRPPPIGHPGEPIQCRCQAAPVVSQRQIDREQPPLTEAALVERVAKLGPTQRQGPDATPAQVRTRAAKEVAGDIRLAQNRQTVRAAKQGP